MRCRNDQRTTVVFGKLTPYIFNILNITQNPIRNFQNSLSRLGHRYHTLAASDKNLHPQLLLKKPDLFRNPWLGSK